MGGHGYVSMTSHPPRTVVGFFMARWDAAGAVGRSRPPRPFAPTQPTTNSSKRFGQSVKRRGVATAQFEALLLDELDVEATAMPEVPEEATDLRMWGMRKGSLASWCTSMRSSLR